MQQVWIETHQQPSKPRSWGVAGILASLMLVTTPTAVWAQSRAVLEIEMTMGLSVSPDYWYVVALSSSDRSGPRVNLVDQNIATTGGSEVEFVREWDYLIRIKPLEEGVLQSTIERFGEPEQEFATGFNEVSLDTVTRDQDTIQLTIDLSEFEEIDAIEDDVHVTLLTIKAPFRVDPEETNLAIDATRGTSPNYYPLSITDQRQVVVDDPQRQETLRRSRELIDSDQEEGGVGALIEGSSLEILAANILIFNMELTER